MKKIVSLILAIALMATMAAIPAMAEGEKYQVSGIRNGDVIVANEETYRHISIVKAYTDTDGKTMPEKATGLTKVEYYNDDVLLESDSDFSCKVKFDKIGEHTLVTKVYYNDAETNEEVVETFNAKYNVKYGKKLTGTFTSTSDETSINTAYSFDKNFDDIPETDLNKELTTSDLPYFYSINSNHALTYTTDGKLSLTTNKTTSYSSLVPFCQSTTTDVIYYDMDFSKKGYVLGTYYGVGNNTKQVLNNNSLPAGKLRLIVDLNSKYYILMQDNAEVRRIAIDTDKLTFLRLRLANTSKSTALDIDNIRCASYDVDSTQDFGTIGELAGDTYTNEIDVTAVEDASITVKTRAMNTTDDAKTLTNIIAVYNSEDMLIASPIVDKDISYAAGAFGEKEYPVALPEDAAKVRVFTFDSLTNIVPVKAWQSAN